MMGKKKRIRKGLNWMLPILILSFLLILIYSQDNIVLEEIKEEYDSQYNITKTLDSSIKERTITFKLDTENCGDLMSRRIRWAFSTICNETENFLEFEEVLDNNSDIEIRCFLEAPEEGIYFTSADATLGELGKPVRNAHINFYNVNPLANDRISGGCIEYPNTEIHEILHTFGFEHQEERTSIMNPISTGCLVRKIDKEIIKTLIETYS